MRSRTERSTADAPPPSGLDLFLLIPILALVVLGALAMGSISEAHGADLALRLRQALLALVGLLILRAVASGRFSSVLGQASLLYVGGCVLLVIAAALQAYERAETSFLASSYSSALPLGVLCLLGSLCARLQDLRERPLVVEILLAVFPVGLMLLGETPQSWAGAYLVVVVSLWFLHGLRLRFFVLLIAFSVFVGIFSALAAPYRRAPLLSFLDPESDLMGHGFQVFQSLIAVGSGGWLGEGLHGGVQRYFFLPNLHSDFLFSHLAEELGFVGSVAIFALFGTIVWRGLRLSRRLQSPVHSCWAMALTLFLWVRFLAHVAVCTALLPVAAHSLPFVSYGSASVLADMAAAGILLNLSRLSGEHGSLTSATVWASRLRGRAKTLASGFDRPRWDALLRRTEFFVSLLAGLMTLILVAKGVLWWLLQ